MILQYPQGKFFFDYGKILNIKENIIEHNVNIIGGSSGSPLIKRYNYNYVIGIHFDGLKIKESKNCNLASPFDIIIKDIIDKLYKLDQNNINKYNIIEYRNIINLLYNKNVDFYNPVRIFGSNFVQNNKNNITLRINGKKSELIEEYELKKGYNNVQIIINNKLVNLECMFENVISLVNIE